MKRTEKTKRTISLLLILALIGLILPGSATAVIKIPKKLNFVSVFGGTSSPVGTIEGIPGNKFFYGTLYEFNTSDAYDDAVM